MFDTWKYGESTSLAGCCVKLPIICIQCIECVFFLSTLQLNFLCVISGANVTFLTSLLNSCASILNVSLPYSHFSPFRFLTVSILPLHSCRIVLATLLLAKNPLFVTFFKYEYSQKVTWCAKSTKIIFWDKLAFCRISICDTDIWLPF